MVFSTSSAEPGVLNQYGRVMLTIDTELYGQASALTSSLQAFESRCRERQFRPPVNHIPEELLSLVRQAEQHEQWVFSVARAFVDADIGGVPTTAAELYEWLEHPPTADLVCYKYQDVTIIRVGTDEYLILVQGTRGNVNDPLAWEGANTWPNNLYSGLGSESDYTEQLRQAISEAGLPSGSKLHFAGHSQGGHAALIIANEIADGNRYQVASYTGFGTYYNQDPNPKIGTHNIYNYENDPVGLIGQLLDGSTTAGALLGGVGLTALTLSGAYRDPRITYLDKHGDNSISVEAHTAYEESSYLPNVPVAWDGSDTYEVVDTYISIPGPRQQAFEDTVENVGMAAEACKDAALWSLYQLTNTANRTVDFVYDGWETTTDVAEVVGDAVVDTLIDWFDT